MNQIPVSANGVWGLWISEISSLQLFDSVDNRNLQPLVKRLSDIPIIRDVFISLRRMPQVDKGKEAEFQMADITAAVVELIVLSAPTDESFVISADIEEGVAAYCDRTAFPVLSDTFRADVDRPFAGAKH